MRFVVSIPSISVLSYRVLISVGDTIRQAKKIWNCGAEGQDGSRSAAGD
jgi:hypothetical protein